MSYLLDALRKAERERNLGRVPALSASDNDTTTVSTSRISAWVWAVVTALVLLNVAALATLWWFNSAATMPPTQQVPTAVSSEPEPAPPTTIATQSKGVANPSAPPSDAAHSVPAPALPSPAPEPEPRQQVILTSPDEDVPHYNALTPTQRSQIPALAISGHLYSSIPGRSFVLVDGRRYHEGARLPQGPAVMLIDEEGALFKFQDIRYRLDAPR